MSRKRRRTQTGRAKRPIDKSLIVLNASASSTQLDNTLLTAVFPCTVMGLRWSFSVIGNATDSPAYFWAIVLVRDGFTASTLSTTDGGSFYEPEQDVMAFGASSIRDADSGFSPTVIQFENQSKAMRKLMVGDSIHFIARTTTATNTAADGVIQFFCKS